MPTHSSLNPTFCPNWEVIVNVGLGVQVPYRASLQIFAPVSKKGFQEFPWQYRISKT